MKTFGQVLESADELSLEEQQDLIAILGRRMAERRRRELIEAVKEARLQFKTGSCRPSSPNEIIKKILA